MAEAVKNSKKKAILLTESAGVKLGELQNINYSWGEVHVRSSTDMDMMLCESSPDSDIDLEPDDIQISDSVTVIWSIE